MTNVQHYGKNALMDLSRFAGTSTSTGISTLIVIADQLVLPSCTVLKSFLSGHVKHL